MMLRRFFVCVLGMVTMAVLLWGTIFGQTSSTTGKAVIDQLVLMRLNAKIQQSALALGGTVGYFDEPAAAPSRPRGPGNYPEWDYWKEMMIGTASLNSVPTPASGLPIRSRP